jgi:hypothetical protein
VDEQIGGAPAYAEGAMRSSKLFSSILIPESSAPSATVLNNKVEIGVGCDFFDPPPLRLSSQYSNSASTSAQFQMPASP